MKTIPLSFTSSKNNPAEGEHNTNSVRFTLSEELRGYAIYIIRRTDGYGETTDSERLYEKNGELTMLLTDDILRGKSLKLQVIAFSEDYEKIAKSEIVEIPVEPSLCLTGSKGVQRDLLVEMIQALNRADGVISGAQSAVENAERAVSSAEQAVQTASDASRIASEASEKANEAAGSIKDGTTFVPFVNSNGDISWSNSDGKPNPAAVNIKGAKGDRGEPGFEEWVEMTSDDTSASLKPNKLYVFPTMASLSYSLEDNGEYHFVFFSGSVSTRVVHPQGVLIGDFSVEPNRVYEVSILKNSMGGLLLSQSWEAVL